MRGNKITGDNRTRDIWWERTRYRTWYYKIGKDRVGYGRYYFGRGLHDTGQARDGWLGTLETTGQDRTTE